MKHLPPSIAWVAVLIIAGLGLGFGTARWWGTGAPPSPAPASADTLAGTGEAAEQPRTIETKPSTETRPSGDGPLLDGRYALLVGCTKYPNLPGHDLVGPGNDVILLQKLLIDRYRFRSENITILSEKEASLDASRRPSRENLQREFLDLAKKGRPGDQVVILLAGHGSREPDSRPNDPERFKPDGLEEIFLPADAAKADGEGDRVAKAVADHEFRDWLAEIRKTGASLWIIVDTCHSASMIRGVDDEVPREVPAEQLVSRTTLAKAEERALTKLATRGAREAAEILTFKLPPDAPDVVALYAAQSTEPTYERPLPLGERNAEPHGLLTYTICEILSQAESTLTYMQLLDRIHAQYSACGRTYPTPLLEGKDRNREVLGDKEHPGRTRFHLYPDGPGSWKLNAGRLHGLTPGSILAVYPPAGKARADQPVGHIMVLENGLQLFEAKVEPCAYNQMPLLKDLPERGRCQIVFMDYGDLRLHVALDPKTERVVDERSGQRELVPDAERQRLSAQLVKLGDDQEWKKLGSGAALVNLVSTPGEADWLLRYDSAKSNKLYLVPASGWHTSEQRGRRSGQSLEKLPPLFGPVPDGDKRIRWLCDALGRIVRARNLLAIAQAAGSKLSQDDVSLNIKVELLQLRSKDDPTGEPVPKDGRDILLHGGDWIAFQISNEGREPADINLLFVDSGYGIESGFPRDVAVNNRLRPADKPLRIKARVDTKTVGLEHLVLIAVKAKPNEPYANFCFLGQETLARARGAEGMRGEKVRGLNSPLGQLLQAAGYGEGKTRGLGFKEGEDSSSGYAFELLRWQVEPR
jgi:hypothetical protein